MKLLSKLKRRRLPPRKGFGLIVFVMMVSIMGFSFILGYSGQLAKEEANARASRLERLLDLAREDVLSAYSLNFGRYDQSFASSTYTIDSLLSHAGISKRHGLQAEWSNILVNKQGLSYRVIALYYPTVTDAGNPPDLIKFKATGEFSSCINPARDCDTRQFILVNSLTFHESALIETQRRLSRVVHKAQNYFKARMLQDPEQNISINYFRPPFSTTCRRRAYDIPCVNHYTPIVQQGPYGWDDYLNLVHLLGLSTDESITAWGEPIEFSNSIDSETEDPPFTMVFRARRPDGSYLKLNAIQQL